MWTVTFWRDGDVLAEIDIPQDQAKTRIHAIARADYELPGALERADDVDALQIPDLVEEGSA